MGRRKKKTKRKQEPVQIGKFLIGLLLVLPCIMASIVLFRHFGNFNLAVPKQLAFVTGAGVYLVMHLLLWKPIFIHVMGHELTHAFWAVVLGGKIKSLLVSQEGGQVTISKTNFFIALAPYFFPIYTFIIIPVYFISAPKFYPVLAFFLGFSLAFHIALTLHSLRDEQSDIRQVGAVFSFPFIYFMNIVVIVLVISVLSSDIISFTMFFKEIWELTLVFIIKLVEFLGFVKSKIL